MINPKILVLDVDGVVNSIPLAGAADNPFVSGIFSVPLLKRIAIGVTEIGESLSGVRYKTKVRFVRNKSRDVDYMGIITDRSAHGLKNALGKNQYILEWMSFIQVRENILGNVGTLKYGPELWGSNKLKPHESVLYRLPHFAESKGVNPYEVLIVDDSLEFRFMAKKRFGFRVYPDDIVDDAEVNYLPHLQGIIAPA